MGCLPGFPLREVRPRGHLQGRERGGAQQTGDGNPVLEQ